MTRLGIKSLIDNPIIAPLSKISRWTLVNEQPIDEATIENSNNTISSAFLSAKVPIDAKYFIERNKLRGAWAPDERCLIPLTQLHKHIPNAANACFYINAQIDGYMIIDIEPECPDEEKARLLSIPGVLYGEASLSGKGYHLLVPLPKNFYDFPIATTKKALKNGPMHWEILLNHWVTFTTKPANWPAGFTKVENPPTLEEVWEEVASKAKETPKIKLLDIEDRPQIPCEEKILTMLQQSKYTKTPADFDNDHSRYEFGLGSFLFHKVTTITRSMVTTRRAEEDAYGDTEIAWLVYLGLKQTLEYRPKHDEHREGHPWLMYRALQIVSQQRKEMPSETKKTQKNQTQT